MSCFMQYPHPDQTPSALEPDRSPAELFVARGAPASIDAFSGVELANASFSPSGPSLNNSFLARLGEETAFLRSLISEDRLERLARPASGSPMYQVRVGSEFEFFLVDSRTLIPRAEDPLHPGVN
ncbi:MAG: hypothetical protein KDD64_16840, partial [Bdellovibrionales bacterium]|nr:hypothetical protein [Bdellovibrionales bacterium]